MNIVSVIKAITVTVAILVSQGAHTRDWHRPDGVKTLEVNGYPLSYFEKGVGTPLVLVHGIGVDYRYFMSTMDALAARYRVISVSLRHHFPEKWDGKGEYSYRLLADDLVAFVRQLDAGPVHLVGHSHGGTVAMFAVRQAPDLFRTLALAEGMSITSFKPAAEAAGDGEYRASVQSHFDAGRVDEGLQVFIRWIGGAWDQLPDSSKQTLRDNAWTIYRMTQFERPVPFPCESLAPVRFPVLLLQGEKTSKGYSGTLDNLANCLKRVDRTTIPGAGHVFPRTHPAEFSRSVLEFTARY